MVDRGRVHAVRGARRGRGAPAARVLTTRAVVWAGVDSFRAELAYVELERDRLRARGTQLGVEPAPYVLRYELETGPEFVTERLRVAVDDGPSVELRRGDAWPFEEALDCDLGFSPLTNTMPILRHGLHRAPGRHELVMAWVSVPDLTVERSEQAYEHLRPGLVRYHGSHRADAARFDLEVDDAGLLLRYPRLAERVYPLVHEDPPD